MEAPTAGRGTAARLAIVPQFARDAAMTAANLADFGIAFDRVRAIVIRPLADTVVDDTVAFHPGQASVSLDLPVQVHNVGEVFIVVLQFRDATTTFFEGQAQVASRAVNDAAGAPSSIPIAYTGPGATVARLQIGARPTTIGATTPLTLSVVAFDASGAVVPVVPIEWTTSDTTLAKITTPGATATLQPTGLRGNVTVTARTPTLVADQATIGLLPAPAAIVLVSGGGQTGTVGAMLPLPIVAEVRAADNLPVPGATVTWAGTNASVGVASATSDANGRTSTTVQLGTVAGTATATASIAVGSTTQTATFGATALAGGAASLQFRTQPANAVAGAPIAPPVQVALVDAFGNLSASTAAVTVAMSGGPAGAVLGGTLTRNAIAGVATFNDLSIDKQGSGYTLTATSGSFQGPSSAFAVSAGAAANMAKTAGDNQSAIAGAPVAVAPSVRVTDAQGNPVSGVVVTFAPAAGSGSVTAGTATTDANGVAAAGGWTVGTVAGQNTLAASAPGTTGASFAAVVSPAAAAKLVLIAPPSSTATSGQPLAAQPAVQVQDQFGNAVPQSGISVTATPSAGTLSGATIATDAAGKATFTAMSIAGLGPVTLSFGATNLVVATSSAIAVSAGPAAKIALIGAAAIAFTAGTTPSPIPTVKITDITGNAISGSPVNVSITRGEAVVFTGTLVTDANGLLGFLVVNPPTVAGVYTVTATAAGLTGSPVGVAATVNPAAPASLLLVGVPEATTTVDAAITSLPTVAVQDAFGNRVPNVPVTFSVVRGGSTLTGAAQTTGTAGTATLGGWTVGPTPTTNEVRAQVTGAAPISISTEATWARRLSGGASGFCAVTSIGQPQCWGDNSFAQLGATQTQLGLPQNFATTPVTHGGLAGITQLGLSNGQDFCGLKAGNWVCWGRNGSSNLANGPATQSSPPGPIVGGIVWAEVNPGRIVTCGRSTAGVGYCWSLNQGGEVGNAAVPYNTVATTPVTVDGGLTFTSIIAGWVHSCGLVADGTAYCWGSNSNGQLGNGTADTLKHSMPQVVNTPSKFVQLTMGSRSTCGVTTDQHVLCWGKNITGQLGDGTTTDRYVPTPVAGGLLFTVVVTSPSIGGGFSATGVVGPGSPQGSPAQTCALTDAGRPYCWGWNGNGQVGDGTQTDRLTPTLVSGGLTLTGLALTESATCGMRGNAVWCWGSNGAGQLGDGSAVNSLRATPGPVPLTP